MKTFKEYLEESTRFDNWVKPSKKDLELEYRLEYEMKGLKNLVGDVWPTSKEFIGAVNKAKVVKVDPSLDRKIDYRSRTKSQDALLSLIKGYRSYPEFRNEKTLQAIYDGFRDGNKMKLPLVLKFKDGNMRILGGNTRADVSMQVLGHYKCLMVEV